MLIIYNKNASFLFVFQVAELKNILITSAIDMDDSFTSGFDAGFDHGTGAGFVNAARALASGPALKRIDFFFVVGLICVFFFRKKNK